MGPPEFVPLETVLELHQEGLRRFGGSPGVRDLGLIKSALGAAQNAYHYGDADIFTIAATFAFHLAQAQAFLDGNKRVAVATALVFLAGNGHPKRPDGDRLYDGMIGIAERRLSKADLARIFRELWA